MLLHDIRLPLTLLNLPHSRATCSFFSEARQGTTLTWTTGHRQSAKYVDSVVEVHPSCKNTCMYRLHLQSLLRYALRFWRRCAGLLTESTASRSSAGSELPPPASPTYRLDTSSGSSAGIGVGIQGTVYILKRRLCAVRHVARGERRRHDVV